MAEESYFNQYVVNPIQNAFTSLTKGEDLSGLPYEAQAAAIAKRQKLAELLMQQGQQQPEVLTYKGIAAQPSVAGGLGKALSQFMGAYMGGKADEALTAAKAKETKDVSDIFASLADKPDVKTEGYYLPSEQPSKTMPIGMPRGATSFMPEGEASNMGAYVPGTFTPGQKLSRSEKTNRIMAAMATHPSMAAIAPMYMQNMQNEVEDTRYLTTQERLNRQEAFEAKKRDEDVQYRTERAKEADRVAREEAAARRQAHADSVALRQVTAAGPSKAYTVTGKDGKTTNFFGTNAEARALSLQGNRVVEGGVVPKALPTRVAGELADKASAYDVTKSLKDDFKPEYTKLGVAGFGGDYVLAQKKKYSENDPAVQWWNAYNTKAGQIRNKLYGASLTPSEIEEWFKIAVNPNMDATTIQANLERQRQLEENAMNRAVNNQMSSGYSRESIEGSTGYPADYYKFNKPRAVIPDKPVDNSEAGKRARLAAANAALAAGAN
jgi:hypothetical protein